MPGSSREKSHRSKLSVVSNRVSVELPHSHLMLLDHPSASTRDRGARSPFPAFPDCHPSMPMSLVEEEPAPPPFPTESASLPAFSCSFPGAAEASPAAVGPSWVPLQPWTLDADTEVSRVLARAGLAMGLGGTRSSQNRCMWREGRSRICQGVSREGKCDMIQGLCHIISLLTAH